MNIKVTILHLTIHVSWTELVAFVYLFIPPWWWPCRGREI